MDLDIFITAVVAGCVGYMIGWILRGVVILSHLANHPEVMMDILARIKKINDAEKKVEDTVKNGTELAIERVNDCLYAYAKDTNQFIAQGSTLKELLDDAHKRFPGKLFFGNIPADDPAKDLAK